MREEIIEILETTPNSVQALATIKEQFGESARPIIEDISDNDYRFGGIAMFF